jgi:hypothetical protein
MFSVKKFGARKARLLAIRARRAGVRNMLPAVLDPAFKGKW